MSVLKNIVIILLIVGGLNWGLVGLFGFDLVVFLFGASDILVRVVYSLVGLAAVLKTICLIKHCTSGCCTKDSSCKS